jgi:hypothetical protein
MQFEISELTLKGIIDLIKWVGLILVYIVLYPCLNTTRQHKLSPITQNITTVFTFMLYRDTFSIIIIIIIIKHHKNTLTNKHTYLIICTLLMMAHDAV